jgi:hypothetical protein
MKGFAALCLRAGSALSVAWSAVLGLGLASAGCGGTAGSGSSSTTKELPPSAKSLQEHMKERAAKQKGAMGTRPGSGPGGR